MIINDYLKNNDMTKYQLAKRCNLAYGTLNDICIGKTDLAKCTGETLLKIAGALDCTVDDLLNERFQVADFNIKRIRQLITPIAQKHKLHSVYLFGSYARNEATEKSDVDLLIDRTGSEIHGILGMNALMCDLQEVLGKKVDLITVQSLNRTNSIKNNQVFISNVMKERIKIYG